MHPALWVSKTGLDAQQTNLSIVSNNLANVKTTGFKRDRAVFQSLLYQNIRQAGGQTSQDTRHPSGYMIGTGVKAVATQKIHTGGNILQTNNTLDIAIEGRGFFQITQNDGSIAYTRDGTFQLDDEGNIVTSNGQQLSPSITVPTGTLSITIGDDGTVSAQVAGAAAPTQIGNITLADFVNATGLQPAGQNLFLETASSGAPTTGTPTQNGLGRVTQGSLESSNVNVVEELVNMIEIQRGYEMNSKAIGTSDEMLQFVNQTL